MTPNSDPSVSLHTFNLITNYVTNINSKSMDLDIKKLQNYIMKHNGQSSEDFLRVNSYSICLLFTVSSFSNKNIMNARIVAHDSLQYGHNIDITNKDSNNFHKISVGNVSKNKFGVSGITAGIFSLSMKKTFNQIISKFDNIPKKYHTVNKIITHQMIDPRQESGILYDDFNTNFMISNVSVNGKECILLTGYVNYTNTNSKLITSSNDKEVIETNFPFAIVNRKNDAENEVVYKISLPFNVNLENSIIEYVHTIQVNGHFTKFKLDTTFLDDNITNDIQEAESYFFNTHFVYDTTWTPRIIPQMTHASPYQVKCHKVTNIVQSPEKIKISLFTKPDEYDYMYIKFTMLPKIYAVGTLKIVFGDIFPAKLTNYYDDFEILISKEDFNF